MVTSNHTAFTGIKTDKVKKNSKGGEYLYIPSFGVISILPNPNPNIY